MTLEQGIAIVLATGLVYGIGYAVGHRKGIATIFATLNTGFERQLNAANYWHDRALLAEQKCRILISKASELIPPHYIATFRKAAIQIMDAKGKQ